MVKKIVRGSIKIGGIEMNSNILLGIMIPFIGTTLGSAMVFFMKKEMNVRLQKMLLGFASGVMIARRSGRFLFRPLTCQSRREEFHGCLRQSAFYLEWVFFLFWIH
mgnify:CR=1 FL=1